MYVKCVKFRIFNFMPCFLFVLFFLFFLMNAKFLYCEKNIALLQG